MSSPQSGSSIGATTFYRPLVRSTVGSINSYNSEGAYQLAGSMCFLTVGYNIIDTGTGSGNLRLTLPYPYSRVSSQGFIFTGLNSQDATPFTGAAVGVNEMEVYATDGSYGGATGVSLTLTGFYTIA